eukprot:1160527-Pelagomonas_calceolata.AAC.2
MGTMEWHDMNFLSKRMGHRARVGSRMTLDGFLTCCVLVWKGVASRMKDTLAYPCGCLLVLLALS